MTAWKHYTIAHISTVIGTRNDCNIECQLLLGRVSTGRSRVHFGYFLRLKFEEEDFYFESSSYYRALLEMAKYIRKFGLELPVYGLHESFYQSGLSADSKYGYISGTMEPVIMICQIDVNGETI